MALRLIAAVPGNLVIFTEVAPGVHRISQGVVNFYLVEEAGKLVVVDAGTPGDWNALLAGVAQLGRRLEDIDAVLVTHAHSDHTGFAERARTEAHATVWIHHADREQAQGGKRPRSDGALLPYLRRAETYRTVFGLIRRKGIRILPIHELTTFSDGEVVDVPGRPRVVHAPGHTAGTAAVYFEGRGTLLTGDALVTRNPLTGRVGPQIMPSGFNADTEQALRSLDALDGVAAATLLPGHGEPWGGGAAEAVRLARAAGRS